jgi:hypothetical protein
LLSAAGSAYAFKRAQNGLIVICYFGEGAASEGIGFVSFSNNIRFQNAPLFLVRRAVHRSLCLPRTILCYFMNPRRFNTDALVQNQHCVGPKHYYKLWYFVTALFTFYDFTYNFYFFLPVLQDTMGFFTAGVRITKFSTVNVTGI